MNEHADTTPGAGVRIALKLGVAVSLTAQQAAELATTIERLERENQVLQRKVNAGKQLAMGIRNAITGWGRNTPLRTLLKQYQAEVSE